MELWKFGRDIVLRLAEKHETKLRFFLAGGLNTVVGLSIYPILYLITASLKFHYLFILFISQALCIIFSFLTNKFMVFRTSGNYLPEIRKFLTIHLFYFVLNLIFLPALVELGGMNPVWAQTLFAVFIIVTSYFWYSRFTFISFKAPL